MMNDEPSMSFGPLKIWIKGRRYSDEHDYLDGDWLNSTAMCEGSGFKIVVNGSLLHLTERNQWKSEL